MLLRIASSKITWLCIHIPVIDLFSNFLTISFNPSGLLTETKTGWIINNESINILTLGTITYPITKTESKNNDSIKISISLPFPLSCNAISPIWNAKSSLEHWSNSNSFLQMVPQISHWVKICDEKPHATFVLNFWPPVHWYTRVYPNSIPIGWLLKSWTIWNSLIILDFL